VAITGALRKRHLDAVQGSADLGDFGTLLVYELVPGRKSFSVVDADHSHVLASGSIRDGAVDAAALGSSVTQAWALLDSVSTEPEAVVVLGPLGENSEVELVLELGFSAPVLHVSEAAPIPAPEPEPIVVPIEPPAAAEVVASPPPAKAPRSKTILMLAGAALIGAIALAVASLLAVSSAVEQAPVVANAPAPAPPEVAVGGEPSVQALVPLSTAEQPPIVEDRSVDVVAPVEQVPAPPVVPPPVVPSPVVPPPVVAAPPVVTQQAPAAPPAPARVGPPNAFWLFPGESPPPPPYASRAEIAQWWANHEDLKNRWLHGG